MPDLDTNGWSVYQKLVMGKLDELDHDVKELREEVTLLRIDFAQQKIKAGLWGGVAGVAPVLIGVLAVLFWGSPV
jgi:hypothetical protein